MNLLDSLNRPFFVLAPMDDVTETVFRQTVASCYAPDLFFTEFVNVEGLQSRGRKHLIHKLKYSKKDKPLIAQIWGKNPENYFKVSKELVEMGFDGVDYQKTLSDTLKKKAATLTKGNHFAKQQQLSAFLIRKGFEQEMVWDAVKRYFERD